MPVHGQAEREARRVGEGVLALAAECGHEDGGALAQTHPRPALRQVLGRFLGDPERWRRAPTVAFHVRFADQRPAELAAGEGWLRWRAAVGENVRIGAIVDAGVGNYSSGSPQRRR